MITLLTSCNLIPTKTAKNKTNYIPANINEKPKKAKKEYTILVGKLMAQEYIPDVQPVGCFESNVYCTSNFYLYKIDVKQVISGEPLNGIIKVARYQHAEYLYKGSENAAFIIKKITNDKTSKLLGTKHFITEYVTPKLTYCFSEKINTYGHEIKDIIYSNCLDQKAIYGELKTDLIELVDNRVEEQLKKLGIFIGHEYDHSDGVNLLPEIDYDDDTCPNHTDLDKYDADARGYHGKYKDYNVSIYDVSKEKATQVKQAILDELLKIKINLDNVKMNFQIIEAIDKSTLYWHYRVNFINMYN